MPVDIDCREPRVLCFCVHVGGILLVLMTSDRKLRCIAMINTRKCTKSSYLRVTLTLPHRITYLQRLPLRVALIKLPRRDVDDGFRRDQARA